MLILPIIFLRRKRHVLPRPLLLVSTAYDDSSSVLTLEFDRAIDITGYDGTQIELLDGNIAEARFDGTGAVTLDDASTIRIELNFVASYTDPQTVLNASIATGIVAVDDGGTWMGAADYVIG